MPPLKNDKKMKQIIQIIKELINSIMSFISGYLLKSNKVLKGKNNAFMRAKKARDRIRSDSDYLTRLRNKYMRRK